MSKIMLVLDNKDDQEFLEKVLQRMQYQVISMKNGADLSAQLIDHFPDVVFASTLGRNEKILNALGKIKEVRGKPKLVFVKQEKESSSLSENQKKIIDGVLYSPVDPFKLIDILASTTEVGIIELRKRYNDMLASDRGEAPVIDGSAPDVEEPEDPNFKKVSERKESAEYGATQVIGKKRKAGETEVEFESVKGQKADMGTYKKPEDSTVRKSGTENSLLYDEARKKKYDEWAAKSKAENPNPPEAVDIQKLRELQSKQSEEIEEPVSVKENRKHFLKTLFSMDPNKVKKGS